MTVFLDLFSGIGGFALGAYWAGLRFDKHYFSEIDDYAVRVYQRHFPNAEPLGDIRNVDYAKLPKGEYLVTGGFPCQLHSNAGLRKGADDQRDLWPECRRILRELRPAIALFENVTGLFTSPGKERKGEFFNGILSDISESGYDAEWQVISAQDAGAPHKRERVWIITYPDDRNADGFNEQTEREIRGRETAKPCGLRADVSDTERKQNNQKRRDSKRGRHAVGRSGQASFKENGEADTDRARGLRADVADTESDRRGTRRAKPEGQQGELCSAGCCCSLAHAEGELRERRGSTRSRRNGLANGGERKRNVFNAQSNGHGEGREERNFYKTDGRQDGELPSIFALPDWWAIEPDVGRVAHGIPSRVDRLKGLGNAVVPQCAEMILSLPAFDRWRAA